MNQFEVKDTCIEFVIIILPTQGKNFKIDLKLQMEEICTDFTLDFLWNKWYFTRFLLKSEADSEHSQTSKMITVGYFCKRLHLRCLNGC